MCQNFSNQPMWFCLLSYMKSLNQKIVEDWFAFIFVAALNIHLGSEKMISKNAMSEFYCNLSMQALS